MGKVCRWDRSLGIAFRFLSVFRAACQHALWLGGKGEERPAEGETRGSAAFGVSNGLHSSSGEASGCAQGHQSLSPLRRTRVTAETRSSLVYHRSDNPKLGFATQF